MVAEKKVNWLWEIAKLAICVFVLYFLYSIATGSKPDSNISSPGIFKDSESYSDKGLTIKYIRGRVINIRHKTYNEPDDYMVITIQICLQQPDGSEAYTGQTKDVEIRQTDFNSLDIRLYSNDVINTKWLCNQYVCGLNGLTVVDLPPGVTAQDHR